MRTPYEIARAIVAKVRNAYFGSPGELCLGPAVGLEQAIEKALAEERQRTTGPMFAALAAYVAAVKETEAAREAYTNSYSDAEAYAALNAARTREWGRLSELRVEAVRS